MFKIQLTNDIIFKKKMCLIKSKRQQRKKKRKWKDEPDEWKTNLTNKEKTKPYQGRRNYSIEFQPYLIASFLSKKKKVM